MLRKLSVLVLVSLAVFSVILPTGLVPRAHAAGSGLVCIAQVTDTTCGASPIFNGPLTSPNSLLRVPIMINNTDSFLGFDIVVNSSNLAILRPFGADLLGSMMPAGSIVLSECVGGFNVTGVACPGFAGASTVRLAVVGPFGFLSPPGATGLLFNAIFQITGTTAPGGIAISFQSGCTSASTPGKCVVITNGTISPVPESTQNGGFDNSDTTMLPYATLSTSTPGLGIFFAGAPTHALPTTTFSARSQNGFNTTSTAGLTLSVSFNGTGVRPTASLSPSALDLTGVASQAFTQTGSVSSSVKPGTYIASVTATYTSQDLLTFTTSSLAAIYQLPVILVDYSLTASPNPVTINSGTSKPVTVTVSQTSGFSALVKLGVSIPPVTLAAGIFAQFSTNTIPGGTGSSILNVTTSPTTPHGPFTLTMTSNSTLSGFTKVHTVTLVINPVGPNFSISASPTSIIVSSSGNITATEASTLTLTSFNFTGLVQLSTLVTPQSLSVKLGSPALLLGQNGQNSTSLTPLANSSTTPGTYKVTILATSGLIFHNVNVTVTVLTPAPADFILSANPTFVTLPTGSSSATSTITLSSLNGFSGTITLSASASFASALGLNPPQLNLASSSSANSTLTITGLSVGPGTYTVTITGTHFSIVNGTTISSSHSTQILVQVLVSPPDFQLFVNVNFGGTTILAGTTTSFGVQINNVGPTPFQGTITLTGEVSPLLGNGPTITLDPNQVTLSSFQQYGFSTLTISTTAQTQPGNYTITVQGTNGNLVHTVQIRLTVLPPPVLTLSPTSGPVGTQVTAHGSGFVFASQGSFSPVEIEMTFDDQLVGLLFPQGSSFNFTFNIPISQVNKIHVFHAKVLFSFPVLDVQANFLVQPEPTALSVTVTSGAIYFPGDTATIFAMTTLNGQPTAITSTHMILVKPDGSNVTLTTILVSPGVYRATFTVPTTGSIGTYAILVKAHQTGSTDASGLGGFEVKPTWLQSNAHNIATATGVVGAIGALGLVALAWRRGLFARKSRSYPDF